jgi:hypothetical protein
VTVKISGGFIVIDSFCSGNDTEQRGFHYFQYLFHCSIEILEEVWRIHLQQKGMQTSLAYLDTGLLKQTGLLEEQILRTVWSMYKSSVFYCILSVGLG